jgi:hypothetical protein
MIVPLLREPSAAVCRVCGQIRAPKQRTCIGRARAKHRLLYIIAVTWNTKCLDYPNREALARTAAAPDRAISGARVADHGAEVGGPPLPPGSRRSHRRGLAVPEFFTGAILSVRFPRHVRTFRASLFRFPQPALARAFAPSGPSGDASRSSIAIKRSVIWRCLQCG